MALFPSMLGWTFFSAMLRAWPLQELFKILRFESPVIRTTLLEFGTCIGISNQL
jgi:hypothetical protein